MAPAAAAAPPALLIGGGPWPADFSSERSPQAARDWRLAERLSPGFWEIGIASAASERGAARERKARIVSGRRLGPICWPPSPRERLR